MRHTKRAPVSLPSRPRPVAPPQTSLNATIRKLAVYTAVTVATALSVYLVALGMSYSPANATAIVELVKSVLTSPVIVTALVFLWGGDEIRSALAGFIRRMEKGKGLGFEVSAGMAQPPPETLEEQKLERDHLQLPPSEREEIQQQLSELREKVRGSEMERAEIVAKAGALLETKQREALYWFFEFLYQFLVWKTQAVLMWMNNAQFPITRRNYHEAWSGPSLIPNPEERETILTVVLGYGLVVEEGGLMRVTDTGRLFVQYAIEKQRQIAQASSGWNPPSQVGTHAGAEPRDGWAPAPVAR